MRPLSIHDYDFYQQEAIKMLPRLALKAFSFGAFNECFPKVNHEDELWNFFDFGGENKLSSRLEHWLDGHITQGEFDLYQHLLGVACDVSENLFGEIHLSKGSALRGLTTLRTIRFVYDEQRPKVFYIGSGAGHTQSLLLLSGYPYIGAEFSQALYLFHNRLWNELQSKEEQIAGIEDLLFSRSRLQEVPLPTVKDGFHLPWWKFCELRSESTPQSDLIVLGPEMALLSDDALRFTLRIASRALESRDSFDQQRKLLLVEPESSLPPSVFHKLTPALLEAGFTIATNDHRGMVCIPRGANGIDVPGLIDQRRAYLLNDSGEAVVGVKHFESLYTVLLGRTDHRTENEKFLQVLEGI